MFAGAAIESLTVDGVDDGTLSAQQKDALPNTNKQVITVCTIHVVWC